MKSLLKFWIKNKCNFAKKQGWVHPLKNEIAFMIDKKESDIKKIRYKQDMLGNIPWDYQYDSITLFEKEKADCNSIHRAYQVLYFLKNYNSYLVYFFHKPIKAKYRYFFDWLLNKLGVLHSHATCIYTNQDDIVLCDYGKLYRRKSFKDIVEVLNQIYGLEFVKYIIQDINWEFKNDIVW